MRIAFTHNVPSGPGEEAAEFDSTETVNDLCESLRRLGHEVDPLEVSGPVSRVTARLEALNPDLCFNTAKGRRGRFRGAFHPALFDRLGIPFTGSDAYVCTLTQDKHLTRMLAAAHGSPVPRGIFMNDLGLLATHGLRYPLVVKPNFEGSSMGITADSVVEEPNALAARVKELLARYPDGVLVQEFIEGCDVVVSFLEKGSPATGGVLEPVSYRLSGPGASEGRKVPLCDRAHQGGDARGGRVQVPARIKPEQRARAMELCRTLCRVLGIRDVGRIDLRLDGKGDLVFMEANALPGLEKGASLYASAAQAGIGSREEVLETIVKSASDRFGLSASRGRRRAPPRRKLRVGLTFNMRHVAKLRRDEDTEAEHDSPATIRAIREAIEFHGHSVVELEATPDLPARLSCAEVDLVFNIAEGFKGRHRESQVPALLEMMGIPYSGSDPTALSVAMDKGLAKLLVREAGFHTPAFLLMTSGRERIPAGFSYPAIVKPVAEGSSKGIMNKNVVETEAELRELAREVAGRYGQPVIAETYLSGREFTVGLLGEKKPRVLPPLEILFTGNRKKYPIYSFNTKFQDEDVRFEVPARVSPELDRELKRVARGAFTVLGCRDVARVDLRLDGAGRVHFIECNPLPGLTPDFSDLCVIAKSVGIDHRALIGEILGPAIRRFQEASRKRRQEGLRA
jgi:D-alanine-D-alanine ligase